MATRLGVNFTHGVKPTTWLPSRKGVSEFAYNNSRHLILSGYPLSKALYRGWRGGSSTQDIAKGFVWDQVKSQTAWGTLASSLPYLSATASQKYRQGIRKSLGEYWSAAPDWMKTIQGPPVTNTDYQQVLKEAAKDVTETFDQSAQKSTWQKFKCGLSNSFKFIGINQEIQWQERFGGLEYLPDVHQSQLKYLWCRPDYWFKRLFMPESAMKDEILRQGPAAIKAMQLKIGEEKNSFTKVVADGARKNIKDQPPFYQRIFGIADWLLINPVITRYKTYESLLNNVKTGSAKDFEKHRTEIIAEARKKKLPIADSASMKSIAAGSIGQVFSMEGSNGEKYILKAIKPGITEQYLDSLKKYLVYKGVLSRGNSPEEIQAAEKAAQGMIDLLKEETDMASEVENTKLVEQWLETRKKSQPQFKDMIEVPKIYASTPDAALMSAVGKSDLASLSEGEQQEFYKSSSEKVMPSFIDMTFNSPHKLLDLHQGNIRVGEAEKLYLIDLGRQVNLDKQANDCLVSLTSDFYLAKVKAFNNPFNTNLHAYNKHDVCESVLRDSDFVSSLKTFLEINPTTNTKVLSIINAIPHSSTGKLEVDKLTGAQATELRELVESLFYSGKRRGPKELDSVVKATGRTMEDSAPTLLHVWANAATATPLTLSKKNISPEDLTTYREKMLQFTSPYFDTHQKMDNQMIATLCDQIKQQAKTPLSSNEEKLLTAYVRQAVIEDLSSWQWASDSSGQLINRMTGKNT